MAWKMYLLVLLGNIILINSQDELDASHVTSLWTWMTSRKPGSMEGFNTEQSKDRGVLISEEMASTKDQGAVTGVTSSAVSIEDSFVTELVDLKREPQGAIGQCQMYAFIILGPVPITISVIGVIGNSLCILVFWNDRKKSATMLLLLQLAVIDTLVLVIWSFLLINFAMMFYMTSPPAVALAMYPYVQKYGWGIGNIIQMIACWLIVYITIQRYVAVCHPHKMQLVGSTQMAWAQLTVLAIVSILFNIPRLMEVNFVVRNGRLWVEKLQIFKSDAYIIYYKGMAYYMIQFVIPVSLLIFFTASLSRQLRKSKMKAKGKTTVAQPSAISGAPTTAPSATNAVSSASKENKSQTSNDVTLALVVVDVVFIICQLINPLRRMTEYLVPKDQQECPKPYYYFSLLGASGIIVNSAVNFFIFCMFGKGFRSQVVQRLCRRKGTVQPASSGETKQTVLQG